MAWVGLVQEGGVAPVDVRAMGQDASDATRGHQGCSGPPAGRAFCSWVAGATELCDSVPVRGRLGGKCGPGGCGGCVQRGVNRSHPGVSGSGRGGPGLHPSERPHLPPRGACGRLPGLVFPVLVFFHYFPIKSFISKHTLNSAGSPEVGGGRVGRGRAEDLAGQGGCSVWHCEGRHGSSDFRPNPQNSHLQERC